ncbi:MAG: glycosyltransferase family 2 protein, partial [Kiritimatiellia bacterium]
CSGSHHMKAARPHISVVVPSYRCAECLPELHRRLVASIEPITPLFEIVLVNDCSPDQDWEIIAALAHADARVKGVNLSRNFGQHLTIAAGIDHADGDWVVVMDGDLQDRPEEIPALYRKAQDGGLDVVFGRRANRQDAWHKILASRAFAWMFQQLSDVRIEPGISNFSISSRKVMDAYRRLREGSRAHALVLLWCGFRVGYVDVAHATRHAGRTTYNLRRSVALAVESITSQSNKPLLLSMKCGFLMAGLSFCFAMYEVIRYFGYGVPVSGWTSLIVSLYFIGGLLMVNLGVLGLYLGKVFNEVKHRPIYLVHETVNIEHSRLGEPDTLPLSPVTNAVRT